MAHQTPGFAEQYRHSHGEAHPTDLTDQQWAAIDPLLPKPKIQGRPRRIDMRAVLNAFLYMAKNKLPLRQLPPSFPKWGTVHSQLWHLSQSGVLQKIVQVIGDPAVSEAMLKHIYSAR